LDWNPQVTSIHDLKISGFVPHTDVRKDGILFSAVVPEETEASLLLYEKGSEKVKCEIPFPKEPALGRVYAMLVAGIPPRDLEYNYRIGGKVVTDPSAQLVVGLERYADLSPRREHQIRGALLNPCFDWGEEKRLRIPYSESVFYETHVRGFTKSRTAKVKHHGTFLGITEKIPYLRELGITALVLMPCYEFDEVMPDSSRLGWRPEGLRELVAGASLPASALAPAKKNPNQAAQRKGPAEGRRGKGSEKEAPAAKINYWGFGPGWLFTPKRSYCATDSPADEFRTMVKLLHEAKIEVILEMSCPEGTDPAYMQACLLWWREIYHVDGFLMLASQDDVNAVAKSPALGDVKLISDYFDTQRMYPKGRPWRFRNLAEYNVGFRYDARKFLRDNDIKVDHIHSYGTYADYKDYVKTLENDGVKVKDDPHRIVDSYINMPVAMAACDLVITRCGACALTEIEAMGRPAVMIPSPMVAENHQYYNGLVLQNAGAGIVIEEKDLTEEGFIKTVMDYINDRAKLEESAKNAAKLHITDTRERIMQALDKLLEK
jgi:hypothetical protein